MTTLDSFEARMKQNKKATLTVDSGDEAAEIFIIDNRFDRIASKTGRLVEFILETGIYSIKVRVGVDYSEKSVVFYEDQKIIFDQIQFSTPAPLDGTAKTHEFHLQNAHSHSSEIHAIAGKGSQLYIFVRDWSSKNRPSNETLIEFSHPAKGLTLKNEEGKTIIDYKQASAYATGWDPWAACNISIDPGVYRLSLITGAGDVLEQTIVASTGWQTQVFLLLRDYNMHSPTKLTLSDKRADLTNAAIFISKIGTGFNPQKLAVNNYGQPDFRLAELARQALMNDRNNLSKNFVEHVLDEKFNNPILGIYGAHLMLRDKDYDKELLATVIGNLRKLFEDLHPDVEALALKLDMKSNYTFNFPPMLRNSWRFVLDASVQKPEIVTENSLAAQVSSSLWSDGIWMVWGKSAKQLNNCDEVLSDYLKKLIELNNQGNDESAMVNPSMVRENIPAYNFDNESSISLPANEQLNKKIPGIIAGINDEQILHLVQTLGIPRSRLDIMLKDIEKDNEIDYNKIIEQGLTRDIEWMKPIAFKKISSNYNPLINMTIPQTQIEKTRQRYAEREKERNRNIKLISEKRFFDIDTPVRVKKFLEHRGFDSLNTNEIMKSDKGFPALVEDFPGNESKQIKSLERILGTNDLVDISFLSKAENVSRTVGRVWLTDPSGRIIGYGTGFLISPMLMITNHHVLPDKNTASLAKIEMDYQFDINQVMMTSQLYSLDPGSFYFSDEDLDYAIVAVNQTSNNNQPLSNYGFNSLIREEGKTIISQWLNIIEHPNGMPKQIGLRENQLVDVLDNFLQYKTDTAPGASGSPVYNERWEVVGLHHSGVYKKDATGNIIAVDGSVWNSRMGEDNIKWTMNEGVRISSILKHMDSRSLNQKESQLYSNLFITKQNSVMIPNNNNNNNNGPAINESVSNSDGSVTFNVPLSVTFRIGNDISPATAPSPIIPTVIDQPSTNTNNTGSEADILQQAKREFLKRGDVLDVRMGYVFENGWITKKRAIVATVPKRKVISQLAKEGSSPLPKTFLGYDVEVSGPTIKDLIGFKMGTDTLETIFSPVSVSVEESRYVPPADGELKKITEVMKVNANVSPEKGWENLRKFLEASKKTLTIGMFDFGAVHIKDAIESAAQKNTFKKMTMAIQVGSSTGEGSKKDDLTDEEMVTQISNDLGNKFDNAWIRIGKTNGWVPSSYHIKVAVRDSNSVSVSSGNWQSSNQPDLEILENPTQAFLLKNYNREWHIILENETIAKAYEKYIKNDYENNKNTVLSGRNESIAEELYFLMPATEFENALETRTDFDVFEAFEDEREFTVTPLLSPDNFFEETLALVKSAVKELLIQNQTFNAPGPDQEKLQELIDAVLQKQNEGVDVKIIFRNFIPADARANIESLVEMGFDEKNIRVHNKCHTKGVIVDREKVMIGSQNWSNDGVSVNRDASLLFEDARLASYFHEIFMHDWIKLAKPNIGREGLSLETIAKDEIVPAGMVKISWSDIQELL